MDTLRVVFLSVPSAPQNKYIVSVTHIVRGVCEGSVQVPRLSRLVIFPSLYTYGTQLASLEPP